MIIGIFAILCLIGLSRPAVQNVERATNIDAFEEDIFLYLNDLQRYKHWSPMHINNADADWVYGGATQGTGQRAAWRGGSGRSGFGSIEIVESQPSEFVQAALSLAGREGAVTFALSPSGEGTTVLIKLETFLGGFPYIQRIAGDLRKKRLQSEMDAALNRLKTIVETGHGYEQ